MTTETVPATQGSAEEPSSTSALAAAFASKDALSQQSGADASRPGGNGVGVSGSPTVPPQTAGDLAQSQTAPGATTGKTVDAGSGSDANKSTDTGPAPGSPAHSGDPLADMSIETLLKHPVLGPQVQSWSDKGAAAQIAAARERTKQELVPEVRASVEDEATDAYLKSLDPDERASIISTDPDLAIRWGEIQKAEQARANNLNPDAVNAAAMTYSAQLQINANLKLLEHAALTDADRADLAPQKYTDKGWAGLQEWSQALYSRVVDRHAAAISAQRFPTEFESYKLDQQARNGNNQGRPGVIAAGTNADVLPDLMGNNSNQLLSDAFRRKTSAAPSGR